MELPCARHGCAACCYDTEMPLTTDDVARLVALGHPREAFVTHNSEGVATLRTREDETAAAQGKGKPCYFLREERCSVYADRPQGCRIYPLVMNERSRIERDVDCPHRAEFPLDPSAKRRIQRVLSNLERR